MNSGLRRPLLATGAAALCVLAMSRPAAAQVYVVAPNSLAAKEGWTNNGIPFDYWLPTVRYQQIYAANQFTELTGPCNVTQIAFRPDGLLPAPFTTTYSHARIDLSTTSVTPGGLSRTFADNIGANHAVVLDGPLTLSSAATGPAGGPKDFDIVISLATPFLYDPTQGSLLMDVRLDSMGVTGPFDCVYTFGGPIGRVYSLHEATDATGSAEPGAGLATRFTFMPYVPTPPEPTHTPEPGTLAMLVGAMAPAAGLLRRRQRAK